MPFYQYRGIECDHEFEVHQKFSEDPLTSCKECGKPVRRVFHAPPIVFKGSGWYVTDSKPTSDEVGGVQKAKNKDESSAQPETSTESKPAASKEPAATRAK